MLLLRQLLKYHTIRGRFIVIEIMLCGICRKVKKVNMVILGKNICGDCEKELISAKVDDKAYSLYMEGIKNIFDNYAE